MVLLRLMFVDRGGSAAGRKARVEGMGENEKAMERRRRERSMFLFEDGGGERFGQVEIRFEMACGMKNERVSAERRMSWYFGCRLYVLKNFAFQLGPFGLEA